MAVWWGAKGRGWSVGTALCIAWGCAAPAGAQKVEGVVREEVTGAVLEGAELSLLDAFGAVRASAAADAQGRYALDIPEPGFFRLRASRLGYATFTSETFFVDPSQAVTADLFLAVRPIELEEVDVTAAGRVSRLVAAGFYGRRERGVGHFLLREEIEALHPRRVTDVFRGVPGVEIQRVGSDGRTDLVMRAGRSLFFRIDPGRSGPMTCYPSISIDGLVVRTGGVQPGGVSGEIGRWSDLVHVNDIEGVEVYPSAAGMPAQVSGSVSPCGAVLIWTKG